MKESFFTCSQRETDCSKTLRSKQIILYGKIPECDKSPYHRRLEKQYNINFSTLPLRTWIVNGKANNAPDWKQELKPYIINRQLRAKFNSPEQTQQKKYPSFLKAFFIAFTGQTAKYKKNHPELYPETQPQTDSEDNKEFENEDSELDLTMTDGNNEEMFPTDPE
jgi:hypothetical protein